MSNCEKKQILLQLITIGSEKNSQYRVKKSTEENMVRKYYICNENIKAIGKTREKALKVMSKNVLILIVLSTIFCIKFEDRASDEKQTNK